MTLSEEDKASIREDAEKFQSKVQSDLDDMKFREWAEEMTSGASLGITQDTKEVAYYAKLGLKRIDWLEAQLEAVAPSKAPTESAELAAGKQE